MMQCHDWVVTDALLKILSTIQKGGDCKLDKEHEQISKDFSHCLNQYTCEHYQQLFKQYYIHGCYVDLAS